MKKIIDEYFIYNYDELTEKAKEKAREKLCDIFRDTDSFSEMVRENYNDIFENSDLELQYSLSSCQGDGLNIYGSFYLLDCINYVLEKAPDQFTEKEKRFLTFLSNEFLTVKTKYNNFYCYYTDKTEDFQDEIENDLERQYFRNIPYKTIEKFSKCFNDLFRKYCMEWEKSGYDYFYEYTDQDAIDDSSANEILFYENGEIYRG